MTSQFIITKEHRRFAEFADAVRKQNTIGVFFGPAGVGKTLSAHRSRTVFYTPEVSATMRALQDDLRHDMPASNTALRNTSSSTAATSTPHTAPTRPCSS